MNWAKLPNGNVATAPVTGWQLGVLPMNTLVRLDLRNPDDTTAPIQFHLTEAQSRDFAAALLKFADLVADSASKLRPQ